MSSWFVLLADAADSGQAQSGPPSIVQFVPFLIIGAMLLMFMRSGSRQRKELQNALANLKKNDKVVTTGGIIGVVTAIKENEDEVTLRVDDTSNTRIRVLKSSIARITSGDQTVGEIKS
jgi:preprotein translocase subunit YajC